MITKTLDLNLIRYLNLFEKITQVSTSNCFMFNNVLFFAVPENLVAKAVGEKGGNIRRISEILGKKIKVLSMPEDPKYAGQFIAEIISPIQPKGIEVTDTEIIINAGRLNKASLIGREKTKLKELMKISQEYFGKELKII